MNSETHKTTIQTAAVLSVVVVFMVLLVTIIILIVVMLFMLKRRSKRHVPANLHNNFYPNLLYYNNRGLPIPGYIKTCCVIHGIFVFLGDGVQRTSCKVDCTGGYDVIQPDELSTEQSYTCDKHMTNSAAMELMTSSKYNFTLTQKQPQEEQTSTSNVCWSMYR